MFFFSKGLKTAICLFSGSNVVEAMKLFASDPVRFDNSYFMDNWFVKSRTRNPQLADLGLTYQLMDNRDQV